METKDWLLFIGPIVGVVVGLIPAYFLKRIDHSHQREKDDRDYIRARLENLHQLSTGLTVKSNQYCQQLVLIRELSGSDVDKGRLFADEQSDLIAAVGALTSAQQLYVPEAEALMKRVLTEAEKLMGLSSEFLHKNIEYPVLIALATDIGLGCYDFGAVVRKRMHESLKLVA